MGGQGSAAPAVSAPNLGLMQHEENSRYGLFSIPGGAGEAGGCPGVRPSDWAASSGRPAQALGASHPLKARAATAVRCAQALTGWRKAGPVVAMQAAGCGTFSLEDGGLGGGGFTGLTRAKILAGGLRGAPKGITKTAEAPVRAGWKFHGGHRH